MSPALKVPRLVSSAKNIKLFYTLQGPSLLSAYSRPAEQAWTQYMSYIYRRYEVHSIVVGTRFIFRSLSPIICPSPDRTNYLPTIHRLRTVVGPITPVSEEPSTSDCGSRRYSVTSASISLNNVRVPHPKPSTLLQVKVPDPLYTIRHVFSYIGVYFALQIHSRDISRRGKNTHLPRLPLRACAAYTYMLASVCCSL
jgi:hypothetical protein